MRLLPLLALPLALALAAATVAPARAAALAVDGNATGVITGAGSQALYTFDAAPGDMVWLKVSRTSGSLIPDLTVYDAQGAAVASTNSNGSTVELHLRANANPPFSVSVHDLSYPTSTRSGGFVLYFTRVPGAGELGPFFNGSSLSTTLDAGDLDSLTFTGQAGDAMKLTVQRTGGSFVPNFTGYLPDGAQWFSVGSVASGQTVTSTLPQTGTYTVIVSAGTFSGATGTYTVTLTGTGGIDPALADVPLPAWALALLAAGLSATGLRRAQGGRTGATRP